jgi:hypothetical protein
MLTGFGLIYFPRHFSIERTVSQIGCPPAGRQDAIGIKLREENKSQGGVSTTDKLTSVAELNSR